MVAQLVAKQEHEHDPKRYHSCAWGICSHREMPPASSPELLEVARIRQRLTTLNTLVTRLNLLMSAIVVLLAVSTGIAIVMLVKALGG